MAYEVTIGTDNNISVTLSQVGQQGFKGADWEGAWVTSTAYAVDDVVKNNGTVYICILAHTADAASEPGVGGSTATYWEVFAEGGADGTDGDGWTGGSYDAGTGVVTFTSDDGLGFATGDLRGTDGDGWTGGSYDAGTGVVTFTSTDALGFTTGDLRGTDGTDGDGWTGGSYDAGTGVVTFTSTDSLGFATGDLRGTDGTDGDGWTGGSYNASTGIVTFTSTDGLGFSTSDLRGADGTDGDGWTGGSYNASTGIVTFTSTDGLGFSTSDLRGADGTGFTGGSYNASTGVVTFTSDDGLGFATDDLRGIDWQGSWVTTTSYDANDTVENNGSSYICILTHTSASTNEPGVGVDTATYWELLAQKGIDGNGAGTVTSVDVAGGTGLTSSGGPITTSGTITVALDSATQNSLNLADAAQQPPVEGPFVDGDKTKLNDIEASATADQTAGEIKTAYESNTNTNAFTDSEQTKLTGIETNADVTDTANVTAAGALMDSEVTNLAAVKAFDATDYATAAQGGLADTATQPSDNISTLTNDAGYTTNGGLVFLSSTDISSAATVDFTAFDDTKYDAYVFYVDSMLPATDGAQASMRMSTDGGSTFVSTSVYTNPAAVGSTGKSNFINLGFDVGNAAGETGFNAVIHVFTKISRPSGFTIAWHRNSAGAFIDSVTNHSSGAFEADLSGVNAVRFYFGFGNITSGTITMYGMVNA